MNTYTVRYYAEDNKVETETIEADSFKTSTHTNGPVTFFRGGSNSYGRTTNGEKVAHYNRVISVRHQVLDVQNEGQMDSDEDYSKESQFGDDL